jgi:hypothetical protein
MFGGDAPVSFLIASMFGGDAPVSFLIASMWGETRPSVVGQFEFA